MNLQLNWGIFIIYCLGMLYIGIRGMLRTKNATDYYVAGRSFKLWIAVPLFAASFISSATMVGYTSFVYNNGYVMLVLYGAGLALGWILLQVMSTKFYNANESWVTTVDLYCRRYDDEKFMRPFMSIFNILYMIIYVVTGIMGVGTVLEVFLNIPYNVAVVVLGFVFLVYTTLGGMYSVAWTNVVQWILLTFCILLAAGFAVNKAGGLTAVNNAVFQVSNGAMHDPTVGGAFPISRTVGLSIGTGLSVPCLVYYHRIYFSLNSKKTAMSFVGISSIILTISYFAILLIGLSARVLLPDLADTQRTFPQIVTMMPSLLGAVAIAGVISAVQSTIDSQLLSAGSIAAHDVYQRLLFPNASPKQVMSASRWLTLGCGIASVLIALWRPGGIMDFYNLMIVVGPTVMFPTIFLGFYWKRITRAGAIFSVLFGAVFGILWLLFGPSNIPATLVILPLNLLLTIPVSLKTKPLPDDVVARFFPEKAEAK